MARQRKIKIIQSYIYIGVCVSVVNYILLVVCLVRRTVDFATSFNSCCCLSVRSIGICDAHRSRFEYHCKKFGGNVPPNMVGPLFPVSPTTFGGRFTPLYLV